MNENAPTTLPIDITALAAPLAGPDPCGPNLEYTAPFLALEEAAGGKPEVQYGSTITPATLPDWPAVRGLALQLMEGSRDLRVAVLLARALLQLHGVPGLAAGLGLLAGLLAQCWDGVHPQLDPDDGLDPTARINVLAALCQGDGMLRDLRAAPLAQVRALGAVSLRDIDLAGADPEASKPPGPPSLTLPIIDAVFAAAGQADLILTVAALDAALHDALYIEQALTERVGVASALDLAPLAVLLRRAGDALRPHLHAEAAASTASTSGAVADPIQLAGVPSDGAVASRADVARRLDALCAWYAVHEPASPVPLLLQRARTLVDKNFTELLQALAPDGLAQLAQVSGIRNDG